MLIIEYFLGADITYFPNFLKSIFWNFSKISRVQHIFRDGWEVTCIFQTPWFPGSSQRVFNVVPKGNPLCFPHPFFYLLGKTTLLRSCKYFSVYHSQEKCMFYSRNKQIYTIFPVVSFSQEESQNKSLGLCYIASSFPTNIPIYNN